MRTTKHWRRLGGLAVCLGAVIGAPWAAALDDPSFGTIPPVLYYNPTTGQSTPFFPISWYSFGPVDNATMDAIAASGANTVSFADLGEHTSTWHYGAVQKALEHAQQIGMKIVVGFHPDVWRNVDYDVPSTSTTLQTWINGFKNHPALLGWLIGDEASSGHPLKAVVDSGRIIKALDPNHQVWQCHATGVSDSTVAQYMASTDVYSLDFYQYFDNTGPFGGANSLITQYNRDGLRVATYGWAGNVAITQAVGPDNAGDLNIFRFPTPAEYRLNVFAALASGGARGIVNWIHCIETWYSDPNMFYNFRDQTVGAVNADLQKMIHALETGWNVGTVNLPTGTIGNHKRLSNLLLYDDWTHCYYFIVTNNGSSNQSIAATFSNLPTPLRNLTVNRFNSSDTLTLTDLGGGSYRLDDTIGGYGVNLYEFKDYDYGCYNGTMNTARGWVPTGNTAVGTGSKDNDGSVCIYLWDTSGGAGSSKWSQGMGVTKNTMYSLKWYAMPGGTAGGSFKYSIVDRHGKVLLASGPVQVNKGQFKWVPFSADFYSGDNEVVTINFISHSYDWVAFDNVVLATHEICNGTVNTAEAWKLTGPTGAYLPTMSKDADGSGCLKLWDAVGGTGSGTWSQPVSLLPNTLYTLRWFAAPGGTAGGYLRYSITRPNGTPIHSGGPVSINNGQYQWGECMTTFYSGGNDLACVNFIAHSYDWVAIDNVQLIPHALVNGSVNSAFRWVPTGHTEYLPDMSRSADGSGSLKLWDASWGTGSSKWSQWVGVARNTQYALSWFAAPGSATGYYKYRITDRNGNVIYSSGSLSAKGQKQWTAASAAFNSGNNALVQISFVSHSSDWVAFDEVTLTPLQRIPGDINGNGIVGFEDFAVLQNHYGQAVTPNTNGDINGDGQVTFEDFVILQNHYGSIQ